MPRRIVASKNAVPAAALKRELTKVIEREVRAGDGAEGERDGKLQLSEIGYVQGFVRKGATGKTVAAVAKDAVERANQALASTVGDGQFDRADLKTIYQKDKLLGELTERAFRGLQRGAALPQMKALPASHGLSKLVKRTSEEWSSANLMGASIVVSAGKLVGLERQPGKQLQGVARELFIRGLEENDSTFTSSVPKVDALAAAAAVDRIALAVDKDGLMMVGAAAQVNPQVQALIAALGNPVEVFCASKRLFVEDAGEKRNVSLALAVNLGTGEHVSFYVRQGNL